MALPQLSNITGGSIEELVDNLERQRKELEYILSVLDGDNIHDVPAERISSVIVDYQIGDAAITNAKIRDLAVTSAKIELASINTAHIKDLAVETAKIQDAAIVTAKIADAQITTAKIGTAQITTALIADANITTAKIQDGSIISAKIAEAQIDTAHIVDASITTAKIADGNITSAKIGDAQITTAKIKNGAITTALIDTAAIGTTQIADGSITSAKIVSLNADVINAGTLKVDHLLITGADSIVYEINAQSSGLTSTQLSDAKYQKYMNGTVIVAKSITAGQIAAKTITANEIVTGTITATSGIIADAAITTAKIADAAITNAKIASLDATKITSGYISTDRIKIGSGVTFDPGYDPRNKVNVNGYTTSNTSSTNYNKWTKIASVKITSQYSDSDSDIIFAGNGSGSSTSYWADLHFRVKQQAVLGQPPAVSIHYKGGSTYLPSDFKAVTITNTTTETLVELYFYNRISYNRGVFTPTNISGGGILTFYEEQPYLDSLPAGAQTDADDLSFHPVAAQVDGWKYPGTTYIDGGDIYTNTITANQIASRTITANEIATGTITANEIKAGTITATNGIIASIDATKITTGTLDASKVTVKNLNASYITTGTLSADKVRGGTLTSVTLNSVTGTFSGSISSSGLAIINPDFSSVGNTTLGMDTGYLNASGSLYTANGYVEISSFNEAFTFTQWNSSGTEVKLRDFFVNAVQISTSGNLTASGSLNVNGATINGTTNVNGDLYIQSGKWIRSQGTTGLYFQSYGGGWYMTDSTWITAYGSKAIKVNNTVRANAFEIADGTDVVSRGSNSNGEYVRYYDGTQICYWNATSSSVGITGAYGNLFIGSYRWTYPASFIANPSIQVGRAQWGTSASWGSYSTHTTTYADIRFIDVASRASGTATDFTVMAIGRWK